MMDAKAIVENDKERCSWMRDTNLESMEACLQSSVPRRVQCHRMSLLPQEDKQSAQVYSRTDANQRTAPVPTGRLSN
ncbi:ATP-dependent RNA helicase [Venturia inaequalis]|nr:ATP-dependent RNA helicase [Venturia inaequalis]